jgi:hypothetical protein
MTDILTGLTWLKNADCFSERTWAQALSDANTLASGSCGLTDGSATGDWRLPNINEVESLINAEERYTSTWLTAQGFSNVHPSLYWSSTTYTNHPTSVWCVIMDDGIVAAEQVTKNDTLFVWPVRSGTP